MVDEPPASQSVVICEIVDPTTTTSSSAPPEDIMQISDSDSDNDSDFDDDILGDVEMIPRTESTPSPEKQFRRAAVTARNATLISMPPATQNRIMRRPGAKQARQPVNDNRNASIPGLTAANPTIITMPSTNQNCSPAKRPRQTVLPIKGSTVYTLKPVSQSTATVINGPRKLPSTANRATVVQPAINKMPSIITLPTVNQAPSIIKLSNVLDPNTGSIITLPAAIQNSALINTSPRINQNSSMVTISSSNRNPSLSTIPQIIQNPLITIPSTNQNPSLVTVPQIIQNPLITIPSTNQNPSLVTIPQLIQNPSYITIPSTNQNPSLISIPSTNLNSLLTIPSTNQNPSLITIPSTNQYPSLVTMPELIQNPSLISIPSTNQNQSLITIPSTNQNATLMTLSQPIVHVIAGNVPTSKPQALLLTSTQATPIVKMSSILQTAALSIEPTITDLTQQSLPVLRETIEEALAKASPLTPGSIVISDDSGGALNLSLLDVADPTGAGGQLVSDGIISGLSMNSIITSLAVKNHQLTNAGSGLQQAAILLSDGNLLIDGAVTSKSTATGQLVEDMLMEHDAIGIDQLTAINGGMEPESGTDPSASATILLQQLSSVVKEADAMHQHQNMDDGMLTNQATAAEIASLTVGIESAFASEVPPHPHPPPYPT